MSTDEKRTPDHESPAPTELQGEARTPKVHEQSTGARGEFQDTDLDAAFKRAVVRAAVAAFERRRRDAEFWYEALLRDIGDGRAVREADSDWAERHAREFFMRNSLAADAYPVLGAQCPTCGAQLYIVGTFAHRGFESDEPRWLWCPHCKPLVPGNTWRHSDEEDRR